MKEMLTTDEVAELLGVSRITVYRLIDSRLLSVYRVRRLLRFRREDIDEYLQLTKSKVRKI